MKNTKRKVTQAQFDKALEEYKKDSLSYNTKLAALNKAVEKAQAPFKKQIKELTDRINANFETVNTYCDANRETLFGDNKSIDTPHGVLKYRLGAQKVILDDGVEEKELVLELKKARWKGAPDFIVEKLSLDKKAIVKADEKQLERLKELGVTIGQDESFKIEI